MSEHMSNVEIEDVLSSIRRLVSDDLHPRPGTEATRSPAPRLVLTQALRVDAGGPNRADAGADAADAPSGQVPPPPVLQDAAAPDTAHEVPAADRSAGRQFDGPALADRLAELEVLLDQQDHGFEEEAALHHIPSAPRIAEPPPVPEAPFLTDAESEAAECDIPDPAELHGDAPDDDDDAPLTMDEDVLRELIRDVLREELQGQMGVRMTRNLRRLVRSEISRALTSRGIA